MSTGGVVSYDDARRLARDHRWREKVLVYVTRGDELLVLEHTVDYPDAGVQVPAGGVEPGESPASTALRELFEETGLRPESAPVYLESTCWPDPDAPSRIRHYFWVEVPVGTPTVWSHVVSAGDEDEGMTFLLGFRPLARPELTPGYGWEDAMPRLSMIMENRVGGRSPERRTSGP